MLDICKALAQWFFLLVSNLILDLLGLFVVSVAIPFRMPGVSGSDGPAIVNLPRWVWLFGNDYNGLLGDKHGWWAANTRWPVDSFLAIWLWAAIRNPVNNMRFVKLWQAPVTGSTITYRGDYTVEDSPGQASWQFVTTEKGGKRGYGFYRVHQWSETRAIVIRLGYKVKPSHAGTTEEPKGLTSKITPYKAI